MPNEFEERAGQPGGEGVYVPRLGVPVARFVPPPAAPAPRDVTEESAPGDPGPAAVALASAPADDAVPPPPTEAPAGDGAQSRGVPQQGALGRPTVPTYAAEEIEERQSKLAARRAQWRRYEAQRGVETDAADTFAPEEAPLWANRSVLIAAGVLLGAAVGAVLLAQLAVLYNEIRLLPGAIQWLGWLLFAVVLGLVGFGGGRLAWAYYRLRVTPRVPGVARMLHERAASRREVQAEHLEDAYRRLHDFLREFDLGREQTRAALRRAGMSAAALDLLRHRRTELLAGPRAGTRAWLEEFDRLFLGPLDELARRRTSAACRRVLVFTGASQKGSIDTFIVLAESTRLMGELCRIYNVRATRQDSLRLLVHAAANLAVAGAADDVTDAAAESGVDLVAESVGQASLLLTRVFAQICGSVADGAINMVLISRLGKAGVRALRPMQA